MVFSKPIKRVESIVGAAVIDDVVSQSGGTSAADAGELSLTAKAMARARLAAVILKILLMIVSPFCTDRR